MVEIVASVVGVFEAGAVKGVGSVHGDDVVAFQDVGVAACIVEDIADVMAAAGDVQQVIEFLSAGRGLGVVGGAEVFGIGAGRGGIEVDGGADGRNRRTAFIDQGNTCIVLEGHGPVAVVAVIGARRDAQRKGLIGGAAMADAKERGDGNINHVGGTAVIADLEMQAVKLRVRGGSSAVADGNVEASDGAAAV